MKALQFSQLLALPLQSAIRAQHLAALEAIASLEEMGTDGGTAKTFRLRAERTVERRSVDPKTGVASTQLVLEPFEVSVPLLALLSPAGVRLNEMNLEFGVEIVEPKVESIKSSSIPAAVRATSLASSLSVFVSPERASAGGMKVTMKIAQQAPEGLARLSDVLTDQLSARPMGPPIERIADIDNVAALRARGILYAQDLVSATQQAGSVQVLAKELGVAEARIREWRDQASKLLGHSGD